MYYNIIKVSFQLAIVERIISTNISMLNPDLLLQVVEDIINQLKLKKLKKFKTSCFRSNLFYDIVYQDALEHSYSHLKKFVVKHLPPEEDMKPVSIPVC